MNYFWSVISYHRLHDHRKLVLSPHVKWPYFIGTYIYFYLYICACIFYAIKWRNKIYMTYFQTSYFSKTHLISYSLQTAHWHNLLCPFIWYHYPGTSISVVSIPGVMGWHISCLRRDLCYVIPHPHTTCSNCTWQMKVLQYSMSAWRPLLGLSSRCPFFK